MALIMHRLALLTARAPRSILESDSKIVRLERAMVDFSLTDEERQIRDTVRAFIRNEVMPLEPDVLRNERAGRQGVDPEVLRDLRTKARKAGFWGINTPEEYGGMNLGRSCRRSWRWSVDGRSCRSASAAAPTISSTWAPRSRNAATRSPPSRASAAPASRSPSRTRARTPATSAPAPGATATNG